MAFNRISFITLCMNLGVIAVGAFVSYFTNLDGIPAIALLLVFFLVPNLLLKFLFWTEEQDTQSLVTFFTYSLPCQFAAFMLFFFVPFLAFMVYADFFWEWHFFGVLKYAFSTVLLSPILFVVMRWTLKLRLEKRVGQTDAKKRKK